jgi:hypothetical protein
MAWAAAQHPCNSGQPLLGGGRIIEPHRFQCAVDVVAGDRGGLHAGKIAHVFGAHLRHPCQLALGRRQIIGPSLGALGEG